MSTFKEREKLIRENSKLANNQITYRSEEGLFMLDFENGVFIAPPTVRIGDIHIFRENAIAMYISAFIKELKSIELKTRTIERHSSSLKMRKIKKKVTVKCNCSMESRIKGVYSFVKGKTYRAESVFESNGIIMINEQEARHYITEGFFDIYFEGDFSDIYRTLS